MTEYIQRAGLRVATPLARFIEADILPPLGLDAGAFWDGAAAIFDELTPRNRALLSRRDSLQASIDTWHVERSGNGHDAAGYEAFLHAIGYLAPEPDPFSVTTTGVDDEIALRAGPQLVVPALNARFALNAANARWGSLYDALYGTDALSDAAKTDGYDAARGARVVAAAGAFLDQAVPLADGSHRAVREWRVTGGALYPALANPGQFAGYRGDPAAPAAILLSNHGLHIELVLDRSHPIGRTDPAGLADVVLEAALTTIIDLEDSVAAVDAEDKLLGYTNWLGLMRGDLTAAFDKAGGTITRTMAPDRRWTDPAGASFELPGRSVMFVRNVGHLMTTPAVLLPDGGEAPEGILDAIVTVLIGAHDVNGLGQRRNSRTGAIYIVKPKMHGPDECAFAEDLFSRVEDLVRLPRNTVKIGVMDEERRTSANLAACIHAVKDRIAFINTGFLDRTGDEIHTSMQAGPMVRKAAMKESRWIAAYEARNVAIGLACGLSGRGQIGKGMWAAPDRMADMMAQKIGHPMSGANTAWVPSPTAATLHAMHYHAIDVFDRQRAIAADPPPPLADLLDIPVAPQPDWSREEIAAELDNNVQGILGYVVRWIDQGVGCSKVPDIHDIGLMEDRATLRISAQHIANWLTHGVCDQSDFDDAVMRMAARVDAQNAGDPAYRPMADPARASLALAAARALVLEGSAQPNGYTEPLLHHYRALAKHQHTLAPDSAMIDGDQANDRITAA